MLRAITKGRGLLVALGAVAVAMVAAPTGARAEATLLEQFNDWGAYVNEAEGAKTCFVISQPKSQRMEPSGRRRGPGFFFVSFRPSDSIAEEISVAYGYPLAAESARAVIGGDTFQLYAKDESAWIQNSADSPRLVNAMRAGSTMEVFGESSRGTKTVDTYSLSGVTAALNRAAQECR